MQAKVEMKAHQEPWVSGMHVAPTSEVIDFIVWVAKWAKEKSGISGSTNSHKTSLNFQCGTNVINFCVCKTRGA